MDAAAATARVFVGPPQEEVEVISVSDLSLVDDDGDDGSSHAPRGAAARVDQAARDVSVARERTHMTYGSSGFKQEFKFAEKHDRVIVEVDRAFQRMLTTVYDRLVEKNEIVRGAHDFQDFRMVFNHNRQIAQWWIKGTDIKGVYDYINDDDLDEARRTTLETAHREIVMTANPATGIELASMHLVVPGCLGSVGKTNLSRNFNEYDRALFAGGLTQPKEKEDQKWELAFADYIDREYAKVEGNPGVREARDVVKDVGAALIYHKHLMEALETKLAELRERSRQQLAATGGAETPQSRETARKIAQIEVLLGRVHDMHMNPLFVSKTYKADLTQPNIFIRAETLQGQVKAHYELIDTGRSKTERAKRWFKGESKENKERIEKLVGDLAFSIGAKEVFKKGDRASYIQLCQINKRESELSLGIEETLFDRLLEQDPTDDYQSLGLFSQLEDEVRDHLNAAMEAAKEKVDEFKQQATVKVRRGAAAPSTARVIDKAKTALKAQLA